MRTDLVTCWELDHLSSSSGQLDHRTDQLLQLLRACPQLQTAKGSTACLHDVERVAEPRAYSKRLVGMLRNFTVCEPLLHFLTRFGYNRYRSRAQPLPLLLNSDTSVSKLC